jgi:hypothetical protein
MKVIIDTKKDPYTCVPQMNVQPPHVWYQRFSNTGSALLSQAFTNLDLGAMMGIIATSASTSVYLSTCFRLTSVKIWCIPPAVGSLCTVQAFWTNIPDGSTALTEQPRPVTDSSLSATQYAYVQLNVPSGSGLAGKWWNVSHAISPLILTVPPDGLVEFKFTYFPDDLGLPTTGPAITAGVAGAIYHQSRHGLTYQGANAI